MLKGHSFVVGSSVSLSFFSYTVYPFHKDKDSEGNNREAD